MAHHDALTDLPNRLLLRERLEDALAGTRGESAAWRCSCSTSTVSKRSTIRLGHPVGDVLLKAVALRLRSCVGETATIARLGGDEFAIVENVADPAWKPPFSPRDFKQR